MGGLSLTPAPVYASNTNVGTASASATFAGDANHAGSTDAKTFAITAALTATAVSCPASAVYTGTAQTPCSATVTGPGGLSQPVTPVTYAANTNVGTASANASYAGGGNYQPSSGAATFTITGAATTTLRELPDVGPGVHGRGADAVHGDGDRPRWAQPGPQPAYSANVNAGTASASASFAGGGNYGASSGSATFPIAKAASTSAVSCPASGVYTGAAQTPCTATATGAGGLSQALTPTYGANTNVGTASASATFAGDANHNGSTGSGSFLVTPAPTVTVVACSPGSVAYSGAPQTPCSATVTGPGGLAQAVAPVTYAANTSVGTATASASYAGGGNYQASSGSATFTITGAATTTTVTCPASGSVYTGTPLTPCSAAVTGPGGLNQPVSPVSYASNTNVGTATASASFAGAANYAASAGSATFTITLAPSVTTVSCPTTGTAYTGAPLAPCAANVTGAGGLGQSLVPTYGANTNAGAATASATFAGDANHSGSTDSKTFAITAALTATAVSCPASAVYTGTAQTPCSATVTGPGGLSQPVTPVTYAANTNVGTASASASYAGGGNYQASSGAATFTITGAATTTLVSCPTSGPVYTGAALTPCTATATGPGGLNQALTPTYSANVTAGTATASASYAGGGNYGASAGSATFPIAVAPSVTTVSCPASGIIYTGGPLTPCSATISGAGGLSLTPTPAYAANVNVGTATATETYAGDANHAGSSDSKNFGIAVAATSLVVTCSPTSVTYSGLPQTPCAATVTGPGGLNQSLTPTYSANVNVGTATASAAYAGGANYAASAGSTTFSITGSSTVTTVTCPANEVYTGSAQTPCSATVTGPGGLSQAVTPVSYTSNTNVGTATATATYPGGGNYVGSSNSATFTITAAVTATAVSCPASAVYTGTAQTPCSATVTGPGGLSQPVTPVTYAANTNVGTASANASYTGGGNYQPSSGAATFTITGAATTTLVSCPTSGPVYTGAALTPCTATATGPGGLNQALTPTYGANVNAGTAVGERELRGRWQLRCKLGFGDIPDREGGVDERGELPGVERLHRGRTDAVQRDRHRRRRPGPGPDADVRREHERGHRLGERHLRRRRQPRRQQRVCELPDHAGHADGSRQLPRDDAVHRRRPESVHCAGHRREWCEPGERHGHLRARNAARTRHVHRQCELCRIRELYGRGRHAKVRRGHLQLLRRIRGRLRLDVDRLLEPEHAAQRERGSNREHGVPDLRGRGARRCVRRQAAVSADGLVRVLVRQCRDRQLHRHAGSRRRRRIRRNEHGPELRHVDLARHSPAGSLGLVTHAELRHVVGDRDDQCVQLRPDGSLRAGCCHGNDHQPRRAEPRRESDCAAPAFDAVHVGWIQRTARLDQRHGAAGRLPRQDGAPHLLIQHRRQPLQRLPRYRARQRAGDQRNNQCLHLPPRGRTESWAGFTRGRLEVRVAARETAGEAAHESVAGHRDERREGGAQ